MQFSELFVYSTNMKHQNRIQIFGRNTDTLSFCPQLSFKLKRDQKNLLSPNVLQAAKNGFEADILMRPESRALANVQPGSQPEKLLAILPLSKMKYVSRLSLQLHISGNSLFPFNLMTFELFDFAGWVLIVNRHLFESTSSQNGQNWTNLSPPNFTKFMMAILSQFTRPARFDNRRKPRYFWPPHQKFWRKILPEAIKSKGDGNSGANRAIIWGGVVSAASHHITFAFSRRKCFDWEIQLVMGGGLLFHSRALVFLFITKVGIVWKGNEM